MPIQRCLWKEVNLYNAVDAYPACNECGGHDKICLTYVERHEAPMLAMLYLSRDTRRILDQAAEKAGTIRGVEYAEKK